MKPQVSSDAFLGAQPFGKASRIIIDGWFAASKLFADTFPTGWEDDEFIHLINDCFSELGKLSTFHDPHLAQGRYGSVRRTRPDARRKAVQTRPYLLLLEDFRQDAVFRTFFSHDDEPGIDSFNRSRQLLLSPLYFLRRMLTSSEFLTSDAYAHAIIRAEIFSLSLGWPVRRPQEGTPERAIKEIIGFERVANSLHKAEAYRSNGDTFYLADQTDAVVGHLLSSLGMAFWSFAPGHLQYTSKRSHEFPVIGRDTYLEGRNLLPQEGSAFELRFADRIERLPSPAAMMNLLDGIPVPIPGADAIFAGGLRLSRARGVVARVSGASGTGKTSLALGVATALAPLGTRTCYLSCEEDPRDLAQRLLTLTPPFIARTTSFSSQDLSDWFVAVHLDSADSQVNRAQVFDFIEFVQSSAIENGIDLSEDRSPGHTPFFVVLDGVHELISRPIDGTDDVNEMRELVEAFRRLGVFVMILTAQTGERSLQELDYLVDVVMTLEHEDRSSIAQEPKRKLVLHKTRLQHSWPGAHHLHISKRDGIKLYPQLPAQLEQFTAWRWQTIRRGHYFDFLQSGVRLGPGAEHTPPLVRIFEKAQILISGKGSSGKAGFGLKLLASPIISDGDDAEEFSRGLFEFEDPQAKRRRILVVSFLYPPEYYEGLLSRIGDSHADQISFENPVSDLETLSFYPGFISPEVLVSKIINKIKAAELEGLSFHGVLIDGLHNVFLQFPRLQENALFWPVLYETFRVLGLTVVTTHTHFAVKGMEANSVHSADVNLIAHRVAPLLQAIVNAADFYINVSQSGDDTAVSSPIELVSAFAQPVRQQPYFWNSQSLVVEIRTKRRQ
ncbi:RAD55 family ATPase [Bradyrhizobium yuanmingense]|uniref:RAD55 family ATPase n=1 Tax=Bradyrhizobium yuanmingense TaxID=108015 RepID=UPI003519D6A6